jgi:hypothetical protein
MSGAKPVDPPMTPSRGTAIWYETGPEPIQLDETEAALIVAIGLARNALGAQLQAGAIAQERQGPSRMRDILSSLVTASAFAHEAMVLTNKNTQQLRVLARIAANSEEKTEQVEYFIGKMGALCGGSHPACGLLKRARNQLGFHWDVKVIVPIVREYAKNETIIWHEADDTSNPVYRLALDVLVQSLLPEAVTQTDLSSANDALKTGLAHVDEALRIIIGFFTVCIYGYIKKWGAVRRTVDVQDGSADGPTT